jgi:flagellar hook-associated protein 3 FlgL
MIKGLNMIANLTYDANYPNEFWALFNEAKNSLDSGGRAVDLANGTLGVARNQMAGLDKAHKDTQLTLEQNISDVEDVNVAEVSANLQTLQFQIQATYATISQVSKLSILDYLR